VAWALSGATSGRSLDEPRLGAPRTISDEKVERVITKHPVPIIQPPPPRSNEQRGTVAYMGFSPLLFGAVVTDGRMSGLNEFTMLRPLG